MNVSQFPGELAIISYIPVVVTFLPECSGGEFADADQALGGRQFEIVERIGQEPEIWFAEQQVDMFGHDDVSVDKHAKTPARAFENVDKQIVSIGRVELGTSVITSEGYEVRVLRLLEALEPSGHKGRLVEKVGCGR